MVLTSKSVGTVPSSYKKRICRAAVSQRLRNTDLDGIAAFVLCFVIIHGQMKCLLKLVQDVSTCESPCSSTNCCHMHP